MYMRIPKTAITTWKRFTNLVNTLWKRLYLPASPFLALTYPISPKLVSEMPRTRRRHHSHDRSSGGHRDKRRRVDSEEASPLQTDASSPPRTRYTRSDAKKRHHESDVSSRVSKDSSLGKRV
ncbi:uncharacterized protein LOC101460299 isoform X2 [Ceratitis capitata]|nr:uncharacterized protein LOC101460299 isoform X2 [Ceratitis capitata]